MPKECHLSHPILSQPTHLSIRMASVLRSFSSHVSFSSAMIFSVSCQGRVKQGVSACCGQHTFPVLPRMLQWDTGPSFRLVYPSCSSISPTLSISPIFKEWGTKTSLSIPSVPAHSCTMLEQEHSSQDRTAIPSPKHLSHRSKAAIPHKAASGRPYNTQTFSLGKL